MALPVTSSLLVLLLAQAPAPAAQPAPAGQPAPAAQPAPSTQPAPAAQPAATPAPPAEGAPPAAQPAPVKLRLWVTPPAAFGLPPDITAAFTEAVNTEAGQVAGTTYTVLTESDAASILSADQRAQAVGCGDSSCFVDLAKVMAADRLLNCRASSVGEDVLVACKLIGVREGGELANKDRKVVAKGLPVADAARALVGVLLTGQARQRRGLVQLKINEPGAEVLLDGKAVGKAPMADPFPVDEGSHEVLVKKDGFATWKAKVDVQAGTFTNLDATLTAVRTYIIWPFGLIGGAVGLVLGGALFAGALTAGGVADCLDGGYWGSSYTRYAGQTGLKPAADATAGALQRTRAVCAPVLQGQPAYRERPIDSFTHEQRFPAIVIVGIIVANALFAAASVAVVVGVASAVALLVTDGIVRFVRREE